MATAYDNVWRRIQRKAVCQTLHCPAGVRLHQESTVKYCRNSAANFALKKPTAETQHKSETIFPICRVWITSAEKRNAERAFTYVSLELVSQSK
eukprot:12355550-Alexandrium_andersonii.AAC.1